MRCCAQAQNPADLCSKRIHSDKFNAFSCPQMIRYILMHWLSKRLLICVYVWRGMFENPDKWDQWGWLSPWAGSQSRLCDTQIQVPEANIPKTFDKYSKFRFSVFEQIDSKPFAHSAFEHFLQRNIVDWKAWQHWHFQNVILLCLIEVNYELHLFSLCSVLICNLQDLQA